MKTLKSIGSVLAGFAVVVVLSIGTDAILESMGVFPPIGQGMMATWMLAVALLYRSVYTIIGGYLTAVLAPFNPMKHVKSLATMGLAAGIAGAIAGWSLSAHWYPIALAITGPLLTLWGGTLKKSNAENQPLS